MKKTLLLTIICICNSALLFSQWATSGNDINNTNSGNIGIGTSTPMSGVWNPGLHISKGGHSTLILGDPVNTYKGGFIQASDDRHRLFLGANLYDDPALSWRAVQAAKGAAGLSMIADEGGWGTQISLVASQDGSYQERMIIFGSGNVGIGSSVDPQVKLGVNGAIYGSSYLRIGAMPTSPNGQFKILGEVGVGAVDPSNNKTVYLYSGDGYSGLSAYDYNVNAGIPLTVNFEQTATYINPNGGQVAIGSRSAPSGYMLAVSGNIIAEKVKVSLRPWPDYVFAPGYKLLSLKEVEAFIKKNNHLPDIPSAKEVEKNGLDLGDNQAALLKKIEELTLYLINQNKRIEKIESDNEQLKQENADFKAKLKQLEAGSELSRPRSRK